LKSISKSCATHYVPERWLLKTRFFFPLSLCTTYRCMTTHTHTHTKIHMCACVHACVRACMRGSEAHIIEHIHQKRNEMRVPHLRCSLETISVERSPQYHKWPTSIYQTRPICQSAGKDDACECVQSICDTLV